MRTVVMAAPWSEDSSTRRSELPSVWPKPRSSGSHQKRPYVGESVPSSTSSLLGWMSALQFLATSSERWADCCMCSVPLCAG